MRTPTSSSPILPVLAALSVLALPPVSLLADVQTGSPDQDYRHPRYLEQRTRVKAEVYYGFNEFVRSNPTSVNPPKKYARLTWGGEVSEYQSGAQYAAGRATFSGTAEWQGTQYQSNLAVYFLLNFGNAGSTNNPGTGANLYTRGPGVACTEVHGLGNVHATGTGQPGLSIASILPGGSYTASFTSTSTSLVRSFTGRMGFDFRKLLHPCVDGPGWPSQHFAQGPITETLSNEVTTPATKPESNTDWRRVGTTDTIEARSLWLYEGAGEWASGSQAPLRVEDQGREFRAHFSATPCSSEDVKIVLIVSTKVGSGSFTQYAIPAFAKAQKEGDSLVVTGEIRARKINPAGGDDIAGVSPGQWAAENDDPMDFERVVRLDKVLLRSTDDCTKTCSIARQSSIDWSMSLGRLPSGRFAGTFSLHAQSFEPEVFTPAALRFVAQSYADPHLQRAFRPDHSVRQVRTGNWLYDVIAPAEDSSLPLASFEVRTYSLAAATPSSGDPNLWVPSGAPLERVRFSAPDEDDEGSRLVIELFLGGSQPFSTVEYAYDAPTSTWSLIEEDQRRTDRATIALSGTEKEVTTTVWDLTTSTPTVVAKTEEKIETVTVDGITTRVVRERTLDPDGTPLTTLYTYVSGINDSVQLASVQEPSGALTSYEYHSAGTSFTIEREFGNPADGATRTVSELVRNHPSGFYPEVATYDSAGKRTLRLVYSDTIGGQAYTVVRVGRHFNQPVRDSWGAIASGTTWEETRTLATGPFHGQLQYHRGYDGVVTLAEYALDPGNQQRTAMVKRGAPNVGETDIVAGTRTVTVTKPDGELVSKRIYDIESGLKIAEEIVNEWDARRGRPAEILHLDGSIEEREYSTCCGSLERVSRHGIATDYTYDSLQRRVTETRAGVTLRYTYDVLDRVVKTERIGSDESVMELSTATYDGAGRLVSTTDARGGTTQYAEIYDGNGLTTRTTTAPDSSTVIEVINPDGSLQSRTGTAVAPAFWRYVYNTVTEYKGTSASAPEWIARTHSPYGYPIWVGYPDGAQETYHYNDKDQLLKQVDPDGVILLFAYNAEGEREIQAVDMNRNGTIDYSGGDRITRQIEEVDTREGAVVIRQVTSVWAPGATEGTEIATAESSVDGLQVWQSTHGQETHSETQYGSGATRTVTVSAPDGTTTIQSYDKDRLQETETTAATVGVIGTSTFTYDPHGRVATSSRLSPAGTPLVTSYAYYDDDSVHTVTTPDPDPNATGSGADPQTTTYLYDPMGRVTKVTHPDGGEVHTTYHPTGAVKLTWGARTYPSGYAYDEQGRLTELRTWQAFNATTGSGTGEAVTTWNYDPQRGWLLRKLDADDKGPTYIYSPAGRLKKLQRARTSLTQPITYGYDNAGALSAIFYPDNLGDVQMSFDRLGRLLTRTDAAGTCTYTYEGLTGAVTSETYAGGILDGVVVQRDFDAQLRLESVAALNQATTLTSATYAYDNASRLASVTSGTNAAIYTYVDNASLVKSVTFTQGGFERLESTKTYDQLNRLKSISSQPSALNAQPLSYSYTYNDANQRTRVTRENNARWDYGYDPLGQVASAEKRLGDPAATPVPGHAFGYDYDDIGNRLTATSSGIETAYALNLLNQYVSREVPDKIEFMGTADAAATVTLNGNPVSRQGELFYEQVTVNNVSAAQYPSLAVSGVNASVTVNETRRAFVPQTPEAFAYDADGNLSDDARWKYTWDAENRLIAMETQPSAVTVGVGKRRLAFAYDAAGRRVSKRVLGWDATASAWAVHSSIRFIYDGWNLLAEVDALASNAPVRTYVWGLDLSGSFQGAGGVGGLLFSSLSTGTSTHASAYDGNGNVIAYVDIATGIASATYEYSAFGETLVAEGVSHEALPFRFSTKYIENESGLLYYGLRYYSPATGKWANRDPWEEKGGPNLTGFVLNNSLTYLDSDGRAISSLDSPTGAAVMAELGGIAPPSAGALATLGVAAGGTIVVALDQAKEKDDAPAVPVPIAKEKCPKDPCKELENRLNEHIDKLAKYKANPDAYDNKNYLKNNPSIRDRIINGRVKHLENEIKNFQRLLENCRKLNPFP